MAFEVDDSTVNLSRYQVWIQAIDFLEQHARGERESRGKTDSCAWTGRQPEVACFGGGVSSRGLQVGMEDHQGR